MMLLGFFLLPMILTLVGMLAVPFLVARHVAAAEAPMEGELVGGWEALEAELELAEIDASWGMLLDSASEIDEWFALMEYAAGNKHATVITLPLASVKKRAA